MLEPSDLAILSVKAKYMFLERHAALSAAMTRELHATSRERSKVVKFMVEFWDVRMPSIAHLQHMGSNRKNG